MKKRIFITKFYEFWQNNSGGFDVQNEKKGIGNQVFIEALTADHANSIAKRKGIYFNGVAEGIDCECCGDRWYETSAAGFYMAPKWSPYGTTYIHYLDGNIFKIEEAI